MLFRRSITVLAFVLGISVVASASGPSVRLYGRHAMADAAGSAIAGKTEGSTTGQQQEQAPPKKPDVIYVPTPPEVVDVMLKTAKVTKDDVVYDLGCGDGRIVITAAQQYGARGVGIDIDPERIKEARANVAKAGVGDRVKILQADLFETPIGEATVVTLYLLPSLNVKLMPKLLKELRPGTRIVSHDFDMQGQWEPEQSIEVGQGEHHVYFWTVPKQK